jgi:hypothetical protein
LLACSVRQPWAWAIIHASKDFENRTKYALTLGGYRQAEGKRIAIHASKGMTRDEYEDVRAFMARIGVECPPPWKLERGGIIGSVHVVKVVTTKAERAVVSSSWWMGGDGLALAAPRACPLVPATGELGLFTWKPGDVANVPLLARWMLPPGSSGMAAIEDAADGQDLLL